MALNALKCNHLASLDLKGLKVYARPARYLHLIP